MPLMSMNRGMTVLMEPYSMRVQAVWATDSNCISQDADKIMNPPWRIDAWIIHKLIPLKFRRKEHFYRWLKAFNGNDHVSTMTAYELRITKEALEKKHTRYQRKKGAHPYRRGVDNNWI